MKERPILFSGPMVRAILEGRKTQTRRVWKKQPYKCATPTPKFTDTAVGDLFICPDLFPTEPGPVGTVVTECTSVGTYHCMGSQKFIEKHGPKSYGIPGDRLWVRETFALEDATEFPETVPTDGRPVNRIEHAEWADITFPRYRATEDADLTCGHEKCEGGPCQHPWRPSIFMPRWASRITLEITEVRVQRLQEITFEDAKAEGCNPPEVRQMSMYGADAAGRKKIFDIHAELGFRPLWDDINAKRGFGWNVNPWVWAISFKRVMP